MAAVPGSAEIFARANAAIEHLRKARDLMHELDRLKPGPTSMHLALSDAHRAEHHLRASCEEDFGVRP